MTQLNIIKISILLKLTYKLNTIPMTIPADVLVQIEKPIVKFLQKQNQFRKIKKRSRLTLSEIKTHYIATESSQYSTV